MAPVTVGRRLLVRHDELGAGRSGEQEAGEGDGERPPTSWAAMNAGAEDGSMPAKVSLSVRPTVTAGLAKLVDEVNQ